MIYDQLSPVSCPLCGHGEMRMVHPLLARWHGVQGHDQLRLLQYPPPDKEAPRCQRERGAPLRVRTPRDAPLTGRGVPVSLVQLRDRVSYAGPVRFQRSGESKGL